MVMQPFDRVERGQDCPFLPSREIRDMLARQHQSAVDCTEIAEMETPGIVAEAAEG